MIFLYTIILGHGYHDKLCRSSIGMVNVVICLIHKVVSYLANHQGNTSPTYIPTLIPTHTCMNGYTNIHPSTLKVCVCSRESQIRNSTKSRKIDLTCRWDIDRPKIFRENNI